MCNEQVEGFKTLCTTQHISSCTVHVFSLSLSLSLCKALNPCLCGRDRAFYFTCVVLKHECANDSQYVHYNKSKLYQYHNILYTHILCILPLIPVHTPEVSTRRLSLVRWRLGLRLLDPLVAKLQNPSLEIKATAVILCVPTISRKL